MTTETELVDVSATSMTAMIGECSESAAAPRATDMALVPIEGPDWRGAAAAAYARHVAEKDEADRALLVKRLWALGAEVRRLVGAEGYSQFDLRSNVDSPELYTRLGMDRILALRFHPGDPSRMSLEARVVCDAARPFLLGDPGSDHLVSSVRIGSLGRIDIGGILAKYERGGYAVCPVCERAKAAIPPMYLTFAEERFMAALREVIAAAVPEEEDD